jgi:hypothetical protein
MVAKLHTTTGAPPRPNAARPSKVLSTHSDEEENSSDGDDSVHTSDEEFIDDDSELDPDDDYTYGTTSRTCSESATESVSELASESGSEVESESGGLTPGSKSSEASDGNDSEERVELATKLEDNDSEQRVELVTKLEGMSLASTEGPTEGQGGGAILAWLNEQAKLEVSRVRSLIQDKFR